MEGIAVPTGSAALQQIDLNYDEANWDVICDSAARIESVAEESKSGSSAARVKLLLGSCPARIILRPQTRDLTTEETQVFVKGSGLYTLGPSVIDGKHRLKFRISQGRVQQLSIIIPAGLTVSSVEGPVSSCLLTRTRAACSNKIDPTTPPEFAVTIKTQRSLDALPTVVQLSPLRVEKAGGELGRTRLPSDRKHNRKSGV